MIAMPMEYEMEHNEYLTDIKWINIRKPHESRKDYSTEELHTMVADLSTKLARANHAVELLREQRLEHWHKIYQLKSNLKAIDASINLSVIDANLKDIRKDTW